MLEICVQMPVAQGRELMQLVTALQESGAHPNLDTFSDIFSMNSACRLILLRTLDFAYSEMVYAAWALSLLAVINIGKELFV